MALNVRARVAIAEERQDLAERDAHEALACAAEVQARHCVPDVLECLAALACEAGEPPRGCSVVQRSRRACGSAQAEVRWQIFQPAYDAACTGAREALSTGDFEAAWAEGAALSTEAAIAYAQRGRGERKRPSSGWASLTPTELDVVRAGQRGTVEQGHRRTTVHVTADRTNPSDARLHEARLDVSHAIGAGSRPARLIPVDVDVESGAGLPGAHRVVWAMRGRRVRFVRHTSPSRRQLRQMGR